MQRKRKQTNEASLERQSQWHNCTVRFPAAVFCDRSSATVKVAMKAVDMMYSRTEVSSVPYELLPDSLQCVAECRNLHLPSYNIVNNHHRLLYSLSLSTTTHAVASLGGGGGDTRMRFNSFMAELRKKTGQTDVWRC